MATQRAEIRIVADAPQDHALLMQVSVRGEDVYCGVCLPDGREMLRQTYHASGQAHIHTPAGRQLHEPRTPPASLTGRHRLFGGSPDLRLARWGYSPRPDTGRRRTLRLPADDLLTQPGWSVAVWLIEQGRDDLIAEILDEHDVIIGSTVVEWTQPIVLAFAWTMSPEKWARLPGQSPVDRRSR